MVELANLKSELERNSDVRNVQINTDGDIVKFNVHVPNSRYDPLTSEVLTILGRYDCTLYDVSRDLSSVHDYWAVAG